MLRSGKRLALRVMSSSSTTHLERTMEIPRNSKVLTNAIVKEIKNISPTIKFLRMSLKNDENEFSFRPGQWVDFHIPGLNIVGGYSMCSSPSLLEKCKEFHLAVKYSEHKPAHWIHTQCKDGAEVQLKVGGDVYHDSKYWNGKNILLIAGGIGINPLFSMFQDNHEMSKGDGKMMLLYSATSEDELVFKNEIDRIVTDDVKFNVSYFVTRGNEEKNTKDINYRRIEDEDLVRALENVSSSTSSSRDLLTYLCGPSSMMFDMKTRLMKLGVNEEQIKFEAWY